MEKRREEAVEHDISSLTTFNCSSTMIPSKECNSKSVSNIEPPPSSRSGLSTPNLPPNDAEGQTAKVEENSTKECPYAARNCLDKLVSNVIDMAESDPSTFSTEKSVIKQIVGDMKKTTYGFIISDLKQRHFEEVTDLFGCYTSEVKNEFDRLLNLTDLEDDESAEPEEIHKFKDYTTDSTKRPILKSPNYRKKIFRVAFPRPPILDDLVYKEVNLADRLWNPPEPTKPKLITRTTVIDRVLQNMVNDGFSIKDLKDYHYQKVSDLYQCSESSVRDMFLRQSEGVEKEGKKTFDLDTLLDELCELDPRNKKTKEELLRLTVRSLELFGVELFELTPQDYEDFAIFLNSRTSTMEDEFHEMKTKLSEEKMLDDLVFGEIEIAKFGEGKVKTNSLTTHQCVTRIKTKIRHQKLTVFLKSHHLEAVAKHFNCEFSEVKNEFFPQQQTPEPENEVKPSQPLSTPPPNLAQDQEMYHEEPVAKKPRIVADPDI